MFLERVKDDFKQRYEASIKNEGAHPLAEEDDEDDYLFEDRFSIAYKLDREFGCVYVSCCWNLKFLCALLYQHVILCFILTGQGLKSTCNTAWSIQKK